MNAQDFNAFLAGLRNGLGFTKSCQILRKSPKEVSEFLRKDEAMLRQASEAVVYAAKALLVNGSNLLQEQKLREWEANMGRIRSFIASLTLWEEYCKKSEVKPNKLLEAYLLYKDWDEVATACGLLRVELNTMLLKNKQLMEYIRINAFLFEP